jgi:hypothetical protein
MILTHSQEQQGPQSIADQLIFIFFQNIKALFVREFVNPLSRCYTFTERLPLNLLPTFDGGKRRLLHRQNARKLESLS